jgi:hypothetical protein
MKNTAVHIRAVIDNFVSIYLETNIDDISNLTVYIMKNIQICVFNWNHGVMAYACLY